MEKPQAEAASTETAGTLAGEDAAQDSEAGTGSEGQAPETLPDWARKELEKVRSEAAGYRTRLRDAEQQLAQAPNPEEAQAKADALAEANRALERRVLVEQAARRHGLPDDLAALVQGADAEGIDAHAKSLARYVPAAPPDADPGTLSGGLNPADSGEADFDPVAIATQARLSRY
jgi:hypothetical protein